MWGTQCYNTVALTWYNLYPPSSRRHTPPPTHPPPSQPEVPRHNNMHQRGVSCVTVRYAYIYTQIFRCYNIIIRVHTTHWQFVISVDSVIIFVRRIIHEENARPLNDTPRYRLINSSCKISKNRERPPAAARVHAHGTLWVLIYVQVGHLFRPDGLVDGRI